MHTQRARRILSLIVTIVVGGLLLGCERTDGEVTRRGADTAGGSSTTAATRNPTPAPPAPLRPGQPWSTAQAYLDRLRFVGGAAGHERTINVCNRTGCPARVRIRPERWARDLKPGDFASQRVIASFELRENRPVPALGFHAGVRGSQSWLLTTGPTTAVVMYESAGKIEFSSAWDFAAVRRPTEAKKQQARWLPIPHTHPKAGMDGVTERVPHQSAAWVSCAEGCCNATNPN